MSPSVLKSSALRKLPKIEWGLLGMVSTQTCKDPFFAIVLSGIPGLRSGLRSGLAWISCENFPLPDLLDHFPLKSLALVPLSHGPCRRRPKRAEATTASAAAAGIAGIAGIEETAAPWTARWQGEGGRGGGYVPHRCKGAPRGEHDMAVSYFFRGPLKWWLCLLASLSATQKEGHMFFPVPFGNRRCI